MSACDARQYDQRVFALIDLHGWRIAKAPCQAIHAGMMAIHTSMLKAGGISTCIECQGNTRQCITTAYT